MIASTDERPYAKVDKLTKKEMGIGIHNHNPKSLKTVKVQRNSEEPKSWDIPKLTKQLEKSCSKSNIITEVKFEPQSLMIFLGLLCGQKTWFSRMCAVSMEEGSSKHGIKCAILVNQSTMMQMAVNPFDFGSFVIRLIDISSHGSVGTVFGCSNPTFLVLSALVLWHFVHPLTYVSMSVFIVCHQYLLEINVVIVLFR
jgi:hypothetical protein